MTDSELAHVYELEAKLALISNALETAMLYIEGGADTEIDIAAADAAYKALEQIKIRPVAVVQVKCDDCLNPGAFWSATNSRHAASGYVQPYDGILIVLPPKGTNELSRS